MSSPNLNSTNTFSFTGTPTGATGGGTLTIIAYGDLDGATGGSNEEMWTIRDENGVTLGTAGGSGAQCATVHTVTVPLTDAQINAWAANGSIDFTGVDVAGNISTALAACSGNDSLHLRLEYCTSSTGADCSGTTLNYNHVMSLGGGSAPNTGTDVTLTFCMEGDYDAIGEGIEVFGEDGSSLGVFSAVTAGVNYVQCASPGFCNTVTIPLVSWNAWNIDGTVTLTAVPNANVNTSCSGGFSCLVSAQIDYTILPVGGVLFNWTPATNLNNPLIASPLAIPNTPTTYTVTATDGTCNLTNTVTVGCVLLSEVACSNLKAERQGKVTQLSWLVEAHQPYLGFAVERSTDGVLFEEIAWLDSDGTTQKSTNYSYKDRQVKDGVDYYYRIKSVDLNQIASYVCEVIHVRGTGVFTNKVELYPNPVKEQLNLVLSTQQLTEVSIEIIDILGRTLKQVPSQNLIEGVNRVDIDVSDIEPGVYYVQLSNKAERFHQTIEFVKN